MNNQNVKEVVTALRRASANVTGILTAEEKAKYLAMVLGGVIAATLDMPSTAIDIPRNFFLTSHKQRVTEFLCEVNEIFPINIDLALSLTDNVYMTRYRLVYEGPYMLHMLNHMAGFSDDVVPTEISSILAKVAGGTKEGLNLKHVLGLDASNMLHNLL